MPEEDKQPFDWKQWLSKQGFISVLLVAVLYVIRSDLLLPMVHSLQEVSATMQEIEKGQDRVIELQMQMRDDQRKFPAIQRANAEPARPEQP